MLEFEGKLTFISEAETFGEGKTKKYFIFTKEVNVKDKTYENAIKVDFFGDKIPDEVVLGAEYVVKFNPRTTEWKGKHYTNLNGLSVDKPSVSYTEYESKKKTKKVNLPHADELPF